MGWCLGSRGLDRHWFGAEFDPTDWPFDDQAAAQVLFFFFPRNDCYKAGVLPTDAT